MAGAESEGAPLSPGEECALFKDDYAAWCRYIAPLRLAYLRTSGPDAQARTWRACGPELKARILRLADDDTKKHLWGLTPPEERTALRALAERQQAARVEEVSHA